MGRQRCAGRLQWLSLCLVGGTAEALRCQPGLLRCWDCGCDGNMTIVILYRNKWIFGKIRVIMMLLSEMRVTMALEYRKIVNKNEFSERGWIYGSYQSGCGCSGWYVGGSVEGVFLL